MENEVLEHATRLFAERGFNGTSLQDIAEAMGLKRPALYYYFKSKDELLDRLIVEATSGPAHDLNKIAALSDMDVAARLHAMARHIVIWVTSNRDRFLLLVKSESDLSPASAKKFNEGRRAALDAVRSIIEEGIEAGQFRPVDAKIAAFGVWGICNWAAWWYHPKGETPLDTVADQLAEMAVAGLQRADRRESAVVSPRNLVAALRDQLDQLDKALSRDDTF
ncbi:TetR family transcriptional regulator [Amycolatopsis sp. RM579]|uniref:TetR family transcriptional regulator n=2 Tax=Amycolatopsis pithecellobii TaxID=664692 RepID=A0A6N7YYX1_9PSEU|nr:TetR family transcriptional regulator [Amycolatopsis pithecellobii]